MVFHLFFAMTVSIRWRVLFPTLCWSFDTKSMGPTMKPGAIYSWCTVNSTSDYTKLSNITSRFLTLFNSPLSKDLIGNIKIISLSVSVLYGAMIEVENQLEIRQFCTTWRAADYMAIKWCRPAHERQPNCLILRLYYYILHTSEHAVRPRLDGQ
jgi:hypothetical protein